MNFKKYSLFILFFLLIIYESIGQEKGYAINYKESDASRVTSSSEIYDPNKFTAAHNTIPIGTFVLVTRIDNGATVTVRINDRGPFIPNRILALSKAAATKIGLKKYEKVYVQLNIVPKKESQAPPSETIEKKPEIPFYQPGSTQITTNTEGKEPIKLEIQPKIDAVPNENRPQTLPQQPDNVSIPKTSSESLKQGVYQLQLNKIYQKGFAVQIGSFQNAAILWKEITKLHNAWFKQLLVHSFEDKNGSVIYKLLLGPFSNKEKASSYKKNLKEKYGIEGFIVSLEE